MNASSPRLKPQSKPIGAIGISNSHSSGDRARLAVTLLVPGKLQEDLCSIDSLDVLHGPRKLSGSSPPAASLCFKHASSGQRPGRDDDNSIDLHWRYHRKADSAAGVSVAAPPELLSALGA